MPAPGRRRRGCGWAHASLHPQRWHRALVVPGISYVKVVSPCREYYGGPRAVPGTERPAGITNPVISRERDSPRLGHPFPQASLSAAAFIITCFSFPSLTQQINFNSKLTLFFCWLAGQMRARQIFPLAHDGRPRAWPAACGDSQGFRLPIEGTGA